MHVSHRFIAFCCFLLAINLSVRFFVHRSIETGVWASLMLRWGVVRYTKLFRDPAVSMIRGYLQRWLLLPLSCLFIRSLLSDIGAASSLFWQGCFLVSLYMIFRSDISTGRRYLGSRLLRPTDGVVLVMSLIGALAWSRGGVSFSPKTLFFTSIYMLTVIIGSERVFGEHIRAETIQLKRFWISIFFVMVAICRYIRSSVV